MRHISEYLDECLKEVFEERAAIREFCGNQPREEAEAEAMSKRITLEEAANNVCRCINDSARRRELEWIRITQGDQFAKLVERLVNQKGGKK